MKGTSTQVDDLQVDLLPMSNFEIFAESVSPIVSLRSCSNARLAETSQCKSSTPCACGCRVPILECEYFLRDLWRFYDLPFGLEVPITNSTVNRVHFVPYLSSIQIFLHTDAVPSFSHMIPELEIPPFDDVQLVLEYFETTQPENRLPFPEQIHALSASCPLLYEGLSSCLHPRSWFSVLWCPLLCDKHSIPLLRGSFLTYHGFTFQDDIPFGCLCQSGQSRSPYKNLLQMFPLPALLSPSPPPPPSANIKHKATNTRPVKVKGPSFDKILNVSRSFLPPPCFLSNRLFPFGILPYKIHKPTWYWAEQAVSAWEEALLQNPEDFIMMFQIEHHDYNHILRQSLSRQM
ncbi:hypothetical protein GEMRC1_008068 [Eukaryota sp. GEM-RC1]